MRILFLGTGAGSTLGSKRFKSSIYIENDDTKFLIDFGSGTHLRIEDMSLFSLNTVFITHLHIDHVNGIFDHLVQRKLIRLPKITVYSPPGFSELLMSYVKVGNNIEANVIENWLPKAKIGDLEVYSIEACHSIYAVSYIITDGRKKIIYSGDTLEPCDDILEEAKDADIIIHECSCIDACSKWGHTSIKDIIRYFNGKNVILTHIPSQIESEILEISKTRFKVAEDKLVINV
jgi:ribonuclease BN (tRNA processing enzyme)